MKPIVALVFSVYQFLIIPSTAFERCSNDLKLELVQVLFRHGARTPVQLGLDVFNNTDISIYEPWGLGELTNEGKQQEYLLGDFLRKRYSNYFRSTYKSEDVYAYASDMSRTKMSMELLLAGLYPPVGLTRWNKNLDWTPVPYTSVPSKLDILLRTWQNDKYLKLFDEVKSSKEYQDKISKYSDFYDFVAENTIANDNSSFMDAVLAFDVLISNEYMNLPLPDWYTLEVKETFIKVNELMWDNYAATTEIQKMGTGPLIKTFIENMNLNGGTDNPRKIYLYGGHDVNIAMFTRAHNIQEFRNPPFGSALIFEKLRDSRTNQIYVRLFAWDGLGHLSTLKFDNNQECLLIDDYLKIVEPVIPSEMEINDMIGSWSTAEIRNLLFNDTVVKDSVTFKRFVKPPRKNSSQ